MKEYETILVHKRTLSVYLMFMLWLYSCGVEKAAGSQQMSRRLLEASLTLRTLASSKSLLMDSPGCGGTRASGCERPHHEPLQQFRDYCFRRRKLHQYF